MYRTGLLYVGFVFVVVAAVTTWVVLGTTTSNRSFSPTRPAPTSATEGQVLTFATVMALPTDIGAVLTPVSEMQPEDLVTSVPTDSVVTGTSLPEPTPAGSADFVPSDNPSGAQIVLEEPTAAPASDSGFVEYTIQQGDVLGTVAKQFNVSISEILAVNSFDNPDSLKVGTVIRIPKAP